MPSEKVKMVLRAFRANFETQQQDIPLALREESPDIVFRSLLEDDEGPGAGPMPMMNFDAGLTTTDMLGGMNPQQTVRDLLGAAQPMDQDPMAAAAQAAVGQAGAPAGPPGPQAAPGAAQPGPGAELAGLLSGMM